MSPTHNTQHIPDLIEHPVSDSVSLEQDDLVEALSAPATPAQVQDAIFGIDRIENTMNSRKNNITFISQELINQKDNLIQTTLFYDKQGKLLPLQKVQSLSGEHNTPLYVRSSHQLENGCQDIRLVSETALHGTPNVIQPSHITDELHVQSIKHDAHNNEFVARVNNTHNLGHKFRIGQRFATLALLNLMLIFNMTSAQEITPEILGFDCSVPSDITYVDRNKRCKQQSLETIKRPPIMVDLLHHTSKDTVSGYYCSIIKSSIMKSCGLFSLEKTLQVPDSEVPQQLSNLQCLDLINSKTYTTKDGQKFNIKIGQETILHFMLDGLVHSSASEGSYC